MMKKQVGIFNKTTIGNKRNTKHIAFYKKRKEHIVVDGEAIDLITTVFAILFHVCYLRLSQKSNDEIFYLRFVI